MAAGEHAPLRSVDPVLTYEQLLGEWQAALELQDDAMMRLIEADVNTLVERCPEVEAHILQRESQEVNLHDVA